MVSCNSLQPYSKGTYGYDVAFFEQQAMEMIQLKDDDSGAAVLISPGYQGRIMTSTSNGKEGQSFGWINHDYIEAGETNTKFNPFGGEERFWLGPEGGPFSIYFEQGDEQDFDHWKVPNVLDTEAFEVVEKDDRMVQFHKTFQLENASGTSLNIGVDRTITLLGIKETEETLKSSLHSAIDWVGYESENIITNKGENTWDENTGFLSIWLLSMFNPSEKGVVFMPYHEGSKEELGKIVEDNYFGKVPSDRLIVKDGMVYFKVDGTYRSKIGLSPERSTPYSGSYDPKTNSLTILWYSKPTTPKRYVNSKWGEQEDPLKGDALNSYNDGPVADGSILGPFYEIESSSPAALLGPKESMKHTQRIFHISGKEEQLDEIVQKLFHVSLTEIKAVFGEH
ncbi:hypothetical protein DN752_22705 [Echinicola strongylocentroti]|uniref:Uncharacterized protein n=2 Tax=Echinicola strongylocentroti TaxID=1795355 RepID=A0A2Z4IQA3_9BACT|nr:hypothetical protein DN752_22705 [Echinicola strongylocentroti]